MSQMSVIVRPDKLHDIHYKWNRVEQNRVEQNRVECNKIEWKRIEQNCIEYVQPYKVSSCNP